MLVGPRADRATRELFAAKIRAEPQNYIAQPTLALSTVPTFVEQGIAPRHVDLRPYVLTGADGVRCVPAGSRASRARRARSWSTPRRAGARKDTWVVDA